MKHNLLKIEYDLDFLLIGIRSEIEDYKFAYFLNKSPFFQFHRMKKDISYIINNKKIFFSAFENLNKDEKRTGFLIKNRSLYNESVKDKKTLFNESFGKTAFLIPELKEFDYLIKLVGVWKKEELLAFTNFLHQMKNAEPYQNINLAQIKSINNLIF